MLTGIVLIIMYGADIAFVAFLILVMNVSDVGSLILGTIGVHLLVSILLMRSLMRFFPVEEGRFPLKSRNCDRWQAQGVVAIVSSGLFDKFLPLFMKAFWYRLFGAKIERGVIVSGRILDPPLLTMKQGSTLGAGGLILGHNIAKDHIVIGRVVVQPHAMVSVHAVIMPNVEIGQGATVGACALVTSGKRIGAGQTWVGVPANLWTIVLSPAVL